jgi:RimJ/RimL family protein N-acetyltransferase
MGEFRLETARLRLRSWRDDDHAGFAAAFNTPAVTRFLGGVMGEAAVDALFEKRLADQQRDGICYWAVEWRATDALVASCGVRIARNYPGTPVHGMLEAGWRVAGAWQERGISREAMRAALGWVWDNRVEDRIGTWTRPDNLPSLALMRSLGFERRAALDFIRPRTMEPCLVHVLGRPMMLAPGRPAAPCSAP